MKPRPYSGPDCFVCAKFAHHHTVFGKDVTHHQGRKPSQGPLPSEQRKTLWQIEKLDKRFRTFAFKLPARSASF